ncbi:LysR family transcriptional regulator [Rahnella sp. SAP-1]|uniref:LysR family transcriptional regulator n=1 Tax=Rouxiella aceris TaxID=2703884 RepID=A0A848MHK8_9GAMM|nr:LysR family transcriptional regulator [Rouxiella aceris]NMP27175.1 LysR family transcriptional regulator [Rouxiella aceris]
MEAFNQLSIKSLRLLVAILEHGSFSEVARREGMSPSTVSRTIQQMELLLQTQLLYRNTRAVVATEAGQLLGVHARRIMEQLEEAAEGLQEKESDPRGRVRINAPVVFGQRHIAPWLYQLSERFPHLQIELMQTDDFIDPLQDATDLLIRIGAMSDSTLQARTLAQQQFRLVASPAYLQRHGTPADPQALSQHSCLVFKGFAGSQRWFFRQGDQAWQAYSFRGPLTGNNAETLTQAAIDGMGFALFPTWLVGEALHQGRLVSVLADYQVSNSLEPQTISAVYPNSRRLSKKVRTVIDFLVEKYGEPAYWDQGMA